MKKDIELQSKLRIRYCFCFPCDSDWHSLTLFNENGFTCSFSCLPCGYGSFSRSLQTKSGCFI